ncbi:HDIG domain-containing protein [Paenibacillus sp. 1_12]|uniref:HD-GYP domain-containing protein n=1 Tax=Paenibacillus sp. 1_12 TaxID=1566278 RepID=UPI0008E88AD0|nr:HD-GYP domain-containing protein [Paenibacillus sp. 1_12]SFM06741.1 HDIG domain-containing protein [Paenibacillus sp. 1_12]
MQYMLMIDEMNQLMDRDSHTYDHSVRVSSLAKVMALGLNLNERQTNHLVTGCFLHDIGKLRIPIEILNKTSSLTPNEWNLMKLHPGVGTELLHEYQYLDKEIIEIVHFHHERWDGEGYPNGLSGRDIPEFARICAIIDAFDCMVSNRPYRKGLSVGEATKQLLTNAGQQFDENYVRIFIKLFNL